MKRFLIFAAMAAALIFSATACDSSDDPVSVSEVKLDRTELSLVRGESRRLTAQISPADADDPALTWTSADPAIVTVDEGAVTALKVGSTTVRATAVNGISGVCQVTVTPVEAASVTLDKTELILEIGGSEQLTATVAPADADDKTIVWSSSDEQVAAVDKGLVRAVAAGEATVTAEAGGKRASCTVTVPAAAKTYAVGDLYDENGVKGVVCWVDAAGTSGKIVSLDQKSLVKWCVGSLMTGAQDENDGQANTEKIMDMGMSAGTFPACEWCVSKGRGWYMPAINEVALFFKNFGAIQPAIKANGGDDLLQTGYYWSSTESENDPYNNAFYAASYGSEGWDKDSDENDVRAMYAFPAE